MTTGYCPHCQAPATGGMLICMVCGGNMSAAGMVTVVEPAPAPSPPVAAPPVAAPPPVAETTGEVACGKCGTPNRVNDRPFCLRCLAPLPVGSPAPATERAAVVVPDARLVFENGTELVLRPGQQVVLGRDQTRSPVAAALARFDTVSRVHATVGRDSGGGSWVRDENATNRTFVNGRPVQPNATVPLRPGDTLGLSSAVVARLHID